MGHKYLIKNRNVNFPLLFCGFSEISLKQITILVAAEGVHKLPTINGSGDLKEALQKLGSIPSSKILVSMKFFPKSELVGVKYLCLISRVFMQAVEVLWTPQNENDTLSERELLEDYPLLRPL